MVAVARLPRPVSLREKLLTVGLGLGGRGVLGLGLGRSAVSAAAGNGLLNSLIAYWPLNEAGGANNALDLHSNGLTLTQVSSPGANMGKVYSTARTFDGSADYFTRNSEALIETGDVDYTFAAWVYLTDISAVRSIVSKGESGSNREYHLFFLHTDQKIYMQSMNAAGTIVGSVASSVTVTTGTWYLLIGSHDALNNIESVTVNAATATAATTGAAGAVTGRLNIGYQGVLENYHVGRIGPVAMWKSAAGGGGVLSSEQRTAFYNGGAGLSYANFTI